MYAVLRQAGQLLSLSHEMRRVAAAAAAAIQSLQAELSDLLVGALQEGRDASGHCEWILVPFASLGRRVRLRSCSYGTQVLAEPVLRRLCRLPCCTSTSRERFEHPSSGTAC